MAKMEQRQKTVFDLDSFGDVVLGKEFPAPEPVTTVQDALARLGNDSAKLIAIINDGILAEEAKRVMSTGDGWRTFNAEGELAEPFSGTVADRLAVNALRLTLAKTVFGYTKDMTADQKSGALDQAMDMIKNSEKIRAGLKKNAALAADAPEAVPTSA